MIETLRISKVNETFIRIDCEPSAAMEIAEYFTFSVPNAKFHPLFKNKIWDGKIRLYNVMTKLLYAGLLAKVEHFAKSREYEIEYLSEFNDVSYSLTEAKDFIATLNTALEDRDYQIEAMAHAVRKSRCLFLSPTASGKSFIIYTIVRYYNKKTLIIKNF